MIVYAESSAVLAWLLGVADGSWVREVLVLAEAVFAALLTGAECERALARLEALGSLPSSEVADLREILARATSRWLRHDVGEAVLARLGRSFPIEPVRTLDAIHLATAMQLRTAEPRLAVLSLDHRVRGNADRLGFVVVPVVQADRHGGLET